MLTKQPFLTLTLIMLASAGCPVPTSYGASCADVANKVFHNCVRESDEPCEGSVYTVAYEACVSETAAGHSVCVPSITGSPSRECVRGAAIEVDTPETP